jgi:hypothetical protein
VQGNNVLSSLLKAMEGVCILRNQECMELPVNLPCRFRPLCIAQPLEIAGNFGIMPL